MNQETKKVEIITINPSSISIIDGTSYTGLVTQVLPEEAENKELIWRSEDPNIASVASNLGTIYGNSVGTTKIYAESTDGSNVSAYCMVTVEPFVFINSITLNKQNMTIGKGEVWKLGATINPENASNKSIEWYSENCYVADVGLWFDQKVHSSTGKYLPS